MEIWNIDSLKLFLIFFIPGFISLKVYQLFVATEQIDFSKSVFEAIGYSCINFAFFFWALVLVHSDNFYSTHPVWYFIIMGIMLFVTPVLWTIFFIWLTKHSKWKRFFLSPIKSSWDYFFDRKEGCWVIVNLKNGNRIGGLYSINSFASAFPRTEQIYLEEEWEITNSNSFLKKKDRTNGILILSGDIQYITFYV